MNSTVSEQYLIPAFVPRESRPVLFMLYTADNIPVLNTIVMGTFADTCILAAQENPSHNLTMIQERLDRINDFGC